MKKYFNLLFCVSLFLFLLLAFKAYTTPYFSFDLSISRYVQSLNLSPIIPLLNYIDHIGFYPNVQIWVGIFAVILIIFKKRLEALVFLFLALIDSILFFSLSDLINRSRPSSDLIKVAWKIDAGSFPSGHVLMYTLLMGFLIYVIFKYVSSRIVKVVLITPCASLIVLTGVARIKSGQHWPSDVFGAYLLGTIVLYATIVLYEKIKTKKFKGLERFF